MAKSKYELKKVEVNNHSIPVRVYRERRSGARASIGKRAAILRLPLLLPPGEDLRLQRWFEDWLRQTIARKPEILERFAPLEYEDGQILWVGKRQYQLSLIYGARKTHGARLRDSVITLKLNKEADEAERKHAIQHLLSRVIAQDFLPDITRRVYELNDQHFQQPVKGVRLKYNHSNWGSCSRQGNINLSTRLLFAPDEVIDYVIIHELAHLIEFNHSPRYWQLVEKALPAYREQIRWLKQNGELCNF